MRQISNSLYLLEVLYNEALRHTTQIPISDELITDKKGLEHDIMCT